MSRVLVALAAVLAFWPRRDRLGFPVFALFVLIVLYVVPVDALDFTTEFLRGAVFTLLMIAFLRLEKLRRTDFAALAALALVATFDPWYRALVLPRAWATSVFFLAAVFGALNVALPLVGVSRRWAVMVGAFVAVLGLTPTLRRRLAWSWSSALGVMLVVALAGAWLALLARAWIPPAPLSLGRGAMALAVRDGEPEGLLGGAIAVAALRENGALVAYTPIHAPVGLRQPVAHVWRLRGHVVDVVALTPVRGGRREGYRTFSRKTEFPSDPVGRWSVDVVTDSGQLIGRLRFTVTP